MELSATLGAHVGIGYRPGMASASAIGQLESLPSMRKVYQQLLGGTRVRGRSSRSFFDGVSMWQALEVASSGAAASTAASAVCISPCTFVFKLMVARNTFLKSRLLLATWRHKF